MQTLDELPADRIQPLPELRKRIDDAVQLLEFKLADAADAILQIKHMSPKAETADDVAHLYAKCKRFLGTEAEDAAEMLSAWLACPTSQPLTDYARQLGEAEAGLYYAVQYPHTSRTWTDSRGAIPLVNGGVAIRTGDGWTVPVPGDWIVEEITTEEVSVYTHEHFVEEFQQIFDHMFDGTRRPFATFRFRESHTGEHPNRKRIAPGSH